MWAEEDGPPRDALPTLHQCELRVASKRLDAAMKQLEQCASADQPQIKALLKHMAAVEREWNASFNEHITRDREQLQIGLIRYSKERAINGDAPLLQTSQVTSASIAAERAPPAKRSRKQRVVGADGTVAPASAVTDPLPLL